MVESGIICEKEIYLVNDADKFVLVKESNNLAVSIQKSLTPQIKVESFDSKFLKLGVPIEGILGVLEAKESNYLMVIDQSTLMGTLMEHKIYLVDNVSFFSYSNNNKASPEDEFYIKQIKDFLKRNTFYYSPTLDLSISMMGLAKNSSRDNPFKSESALFPYSQSHFLWNYNNTRKIDDVNLKEFIPSVINGFIALKPINSYDTEFTFCVISRKDSRRSGCRFLVRGADSNGYVANFAETEQIIAINNPSTNEFNVLSHMQIRGSIPLIWNQKPNLQLNPAIIPSSDLSLHSNAFNRHITQLLSTYDKVTLVNLIDKKGHQNVIGEYYQNLYQNSKTLFQPNNSSGLESFVNMTWFDFHAECKKMKYQNLSNLLRATSVSSSLNSQDFTQFYIKKSKERIGFDNLTKVNVVSIQKGVFRTNCVDNLDRTNVVQSVFGRQFLHKMLYRLKIADMPHGNPFEEFNPGFEGNYKIFWGDNGDYLSKAYSGTRALKRDFTRTGKRTIGGALEDGVNTSTRFYINNFCDGYNQDCHDFYLGHINPKKNNFKKHSTFLVNSLFIINFIFAFFLYNLSTSIAFNNDQENRTYSQVLLKLMIFGGMFLMSTLSLFNGFKNSIIDHSTVNYF
jgi:hypothetical protein